MIILSLTDYRAMADILGPVADRLAGRTIVILSSDNPDRTRDAARWTTDHGASFLTAGVMVPAPMLGTAAAYVYYSGPSVIFDQYRDLLAAIGEPRFLGSDPGLAQLMYQAQLDIFLSALSGLMHATALAGRGGISATAFIPEALQTLTGIGPILSVGGDLGRQLDEHDHPGDLSTVTMMGATAEHILQTSRSAGVDTALPAAVLAHYRTAIDDGHGGDNWTRIIDGIRRGDGDPARSGVGMSAATVLGLGQMGRALYDHASVQQVLDPIADQLQGRAVINLTTSTPGEARELAGGAADRRIGYLDGAIMATPPMIRPRSGRVLYSGDRSVFDWNAELLSVFGSSSFEGTEPGTAALYDLPCCRRCMSCSPVSCMVPR